MISPQRRQAFLAQLEAKIKERGWVVQYVFPEEGNSSPSFTYTTGLHAHGLPELVTFSLPPETSQRLLNEIAADLMLRKATKQTAGGDYTHANWVFPLYLLEADPELASEYATFAWNRSNGAARFLQVVWPDPYERFPWDPRYGTKFKGMQPLLGSPPLSTTGPDKEKAAR